MKLAGEEVDHRNGRFPVLSRLVPVVLLLLAISACGSSSENATSGDQESSGNSARVTIGSETFEVPPDGLNLCNSLDNLISGSFAIAADGSPTQAGGPDAATQINFGVPVANWEEEGLSAPIVNLDLLDEGIRWFASTDRGLGSVDSWELAGGSATGQASFEAEEAGSGAVVGAESGTFEIVCR